MNLERGICRLSVVPVRMNPEEKSEMVSQLLFGEHYSVLEVSKDNKWIKVENYFDKYSGWISIQQHTRITDEHFEQINFTDYKICLDISSEILYNKTKIHVVMGSILPFSQNELFDSTEHFAFNGEAKSLGQKRDYEYLKTISSKYLNAPYLWGGKTPFGIDCSGFVQQVYKIVGYPLKRDSTEQAKQGIPVKYKERKAGDLAFFNNKKQNISHVGIILDRDLIIHASGRVKIDNFSNEGMVNQTNNTVTHQLIELRRILKTNESPGIST